MMTRDRAIEMARARLERDGWPRLQMSGIVLATAAAGLLASYALLQLGLYSMAARYPAALLVAYAVFLALIGCWLRLRRDAGADAIETGLDAGLSPSTHAPRGCSNGDLLPDLDVDPEAAIPVAAMAALVAIAAAAVIALGWVVWTAPLLMAELIVDAAIAGGLYRSLRRQSAEGWWYVTIRRTVLPFLGLLMFAWAGGLAAGLYSPDAVTLYQVLEVLRLP